MKKIIVFILATLMLCSCTSVPTMNTDGQLDTKGTGWGLVRKKGTEPEVPTSQQELIAKYGGYYMDKSGQKNLYLTFDEGYENGYTAKILDVLAETQTPAAFFVTGPYLENQTELVQRMIDDGHIVGNHTVKHLNLANQNESVVKDEIDNLTKKCEEMYGVSMHYVRPPEGVYSERVLAQIQQMGYKTIFWSFAYKDWDVNLQQGKQYAFDSVTPYLHEGGIMLLHAVSSDNANALEDIINYAKNQGFTFKSLDELPEN